MHQEQRGVLERWLPVEMGGHGTPNTCDLLEKVAEALDGGREGREERDGGVATDEGDREDEDGLTLLANQIHLLMDSAPANSDGEFPLPWQQPSIEYTFRLRHHGSPLDSSWYMSKLSQVSRLLYTNGSVSSPVMVVFLPSYQIPCPACWFSSLSSHCLRMALEEHL